MALVIPRLPDLGAAADGRVWILGASVCWLREHPSASDVRNDDPRGVAPPRAAPSGA
jgi:hypothetical protein